MVASLVGQDSGGANSATLNLQWADVGTLANGDIALLFWSYSTSVSPSGGAPSGFTQLPTAGSWPVEDSTLRTTLWQKELDGTESGNLVCLLDNLTRQTACLLVFRGVGPVTANVASKIETGTSATHSYNAVTFTGTAAIVASVHERATPPSTDVTTAPSGYTKQSFSGPGGSGGTFTAVFVKDGSLTTPVSSPQTPGDVTDNASVANCITYAVALPVGGGQSKSLPTASETDTAQALARTKTLSMNGALNWLDNTTAEHAVEPWTTNNHLGARDPAQSVTRSTEQAHSGVGSIKAVWPNSNLGSDTYQGNDGLLASRLHVGKSYTFSCWVYVPTGSPDVNLGFALKSGGSTITAKDQWVQSSWADTMDTNHVAVGVQTVGTPITAGTVCYSDDFVLVETGSTPPVDVAQPMARSKTKALPVATETETPQELARTKTKGTHEAAFEYEDAVPLTGVHGYTLPVATESEAGQAVGRLHSYLLPVGAPEHDEALSLVRPVIVKPLPVAGEMLHNLTAEETADPWAPSP